jgi:hypothetical protein
LEDDGTFHLRQINADDVDGSFYDLDKFYNGNVVMDSVISALVTGDEHAIFADDRVKHATYLSDDSIVKSLMPKFVVRHDTTDFYSRSHHHGNNHLLQYAKQLYAKNSDDKNFVARNNVEAELQITADYIDETTPHFARNIIIKSNHDEAFDRWLSECNPKDDPENAVFYYYMRYHQYKHVTPTGTGYQSIDPFEFWCSNPESQSGLQCVDQTTFLKRDQDFMINGIEVGFHGDVGPNGSRGNIKQFSKIGPKTIVGHSQTTQLNY